MSTLVLAFAITGAQLLLALAMGCAAFRILRGPRAQDRVLGMDSLYIGGMLLNITLCFIIFAVGFWGVLVLTYPRVPWDLLQYGLVAAMILLPIALYPISRLVWLAADLAVRPRSERTPEK